MLVWEVLADPSSSPQNSSPVVSLVPILLPSHTINNENENKSNINKYDLNQSIKCGLIAALESGIFTVWDLSTLIIRPFEARGVPTCIYKICLYEHPAGFFEKVIGKIHIFRYLNEL